MTNKRLWLKRKIKAQKKMYMCVCVRVCVYIYISKLNNRSRGWTEGSFLLATTRIWKGDSNYFPWIAPITLDPYLIILRFNQGGIKNHLVSYWHVSTWDWTPVSLALGEHCNHYINVSVKYVHTHTHTHTHIYIYIYIYIYTHTHIYIYIYIYIHI